MLAAVETGAFDVIVARHMDRLLRRLSELERVIEICERNKVRVVTALDGVDTSTDGGRLVARIMGSVAQGEVERKAARQRSSTLQAAQQGRWVGGRRPFGYDADGVTVRDVEAALIRNGYDAVLAGESLASIARMWTAAGALTPVGNAWNHIGVRQVLTNPRNAGLRRHRPAGSELDAKRDPTAFIVGRAQWDPIVEEDTWRAVAHLLTDPSRRRDRGVRALLTGVAVCGVCGGGMSAGSRRAGHPSQYRCAKNPQCFTRQMPPVDEYVCEAVLRRLEAPDALRLFALPDATGNVDYAAEATTLRRRLDDLAEDYADGALTRQQFRTANERVRVKLADVETAMTRAGARDMIGPLISGGDVRAVWADLSTARRRAVIADVATVTLFPVGKGGRGLDPDTVHVRWRVSEL